MMFKLVVVLAGCLGLLVNDAMGAGGNFGNVCIPYGPGVTSGVCTSDSDCSGCGLLPPTVVAAGSRWACRPITVNKCQLT